jgi:hypothetical protein
MICRYSNEGIYQGIEIECKGVCEEMVNDLRCCVECPKSCGIECEIAKTIKRIEENDEKSN